MAVVSTGDFARSVEPLMPNWYGLGYERYPEVFRRIMTVKSSNDAVEEDALISGLDLMVATSEGESTPYDSLSQSLVSRYMHTDYRTGVIVTANMIADGKGLKILEQKTRALGVSHLETKNTVAANVYNRAFNSSFTGADGVELCSTAHTSTNGNWSNELATSADLSEAALEQADEEMGDIRDDRGLRIHTFGKSLMVPRALKYEACRILKSDLRVGTAENDINALKSMHDFSEGVTVVDHFTDTDAWFIKTNHDMQGVCMYIRKELELTNDTHFDTDNVKFKAHCRFSTGWTDPRAVFGSPGA